MKLFTKIPAPTEKSYSVSIESEVNNESKYMTNRIFSEEQFSEKAKQHLYLLGMNITQDDVKNNVSWEAYVQTLDELFQWTYNPWEKVLNIRVVERYEYTKTPYQLNTKDSLKQYVLEQLKY